MTNNQGRNIISLTNTQRVVNLADMKAELLVFHQHRVMTESISVILIRVRWAAAAAAVVQSTSRQVVFGCWCWRHWIRQDTCFLAGMTYTRTHFISSVTVITTLESYIIKTLPSVLWRCWLGNRKGIRPVENRVVMCWHGYLSGARCRLACGPADATATQ